MYAFRSESSNDFSFHIYTTNKINVYEVGGETIQERRSPDSTPLPRKSPRPFGEVHPISPSVSQDTCVCPVDFQNGLTKG